MTSNFTNKRNTNNSLELYIPPNIHTTNMKTTTKIMLLKQDELWANAHLWYPHRFPRYGVPIWSLWPNIRFLPSIVAEKNATKNEHISSMCIKINKVGKQEVGIWWVQKRFPRYGVPIWRLWPNIRFLPSIVAEKNATKNILGRTDRGKTVYTPPPVGRWYKKNSIPPSGGVGV